MPESKRTKLKWTAMVVSHMPWLFFFTHRVLQKQKQERERERAKEDFLALVPVYFRLTLLAVVCVGSTDAVT